MDDKQYNITVIPGGQVLQGFGGDNLYTLLLVAGLIRAGEPLSERICLEKGSVSPSEDSEAEAAAFTPAELAEGWMLASCRRIDGDATVRLGSETQPEQALYDPLSEGYGLAFDIGAGTVAAGLVNLDTMKLPLLAAWRNAQQDIAMELPERIRYARSQEGGGEELKQALLDDMNGLAAKLMAKVGVSGEEVRSVVCAGNHALMNMLLGDLEQQQGLVGRYKAQTLGLDAINAQADIYILPSAAADIGADTVSACLANGLLQRRDKRSIDLLVDLGMSGEIIAAGRGRLLAASIASLPFEGAGVSCGMPAMTGAITRVSFEDERVILKTVRNGHPRGLSGAGLLSAVQALRELGFIDGEGKLRAPENAPDFLVKRLRSGGGGREFLLSRGDKAFPRDICLSQDDILQVQMAKGAIYAACCAMLDALGATNAALGEIMIAEAFRANFQPETVLALSLIPPIAPGQVRSIGNASWQGAYLALSNRRYLEEARQVAASIERLDLNTSAVYADRFIKGMNF